MSKAAKLGLGLGGSAGVEGERRGERLHGIDDDISGAVALTVREMVRDMPRLVRQEYS